MSRFMKATFMKPPMMLMLSVLFLVSLFMGGCGNSAVGFGLQAEFVTIAQNAPLPFKDTSVTLLILRNEEELGALWQQIHAGESEPPPVPRVGFPEEMVIALVDAVRPTGGYSIAITAIQPTDQGIYVNGVQTSPGPNCVVAQTLTQPYHLVTVSWFPGKPVLNLISTTGDCEQP